MTEPIVASVVVPCAGDLAELPDLVASLDAQQASFRWEVVFVDNGLASPARALLDEAIAALVNARVIHEPTRGIGPARNAGVAAAAGRIVAFIDADDVATSTWLEALVTSVEPGAIAAGVLELEELNPPWLARSRGVHVPGEVYMCEGVLPVAPGGNMALTRTDFDRLGGFATDHRALEDFDLALRARDLGIAVRSAGAEASIHYRLRAVPSALFRQGFRYGEGRSRTYAELWRRGLVRRWTLQGWKSWALLVVVAARVPFNSDQRGLLAWIAGNRLGRLRGSMKHRVVYV